MNELTGYFRKSFGFRFAILATLFPGLGLITVPLQANPSGANVIAGNVNFQGLGTANLDINNLSQNAIINWQSFSIQQGETTRINQSASSFTLNRVVSGNPTAIYGSLVAAQGGVAVINPNGILVGPGGTIDVAGMLTLSTLDIDNDDFLNGGDNRFYGNSDTGVVNQGSIFSTDGDVILLGGFVDNSGQIGAMNGTVALGAGGDILVSDGTDGRISIQGGSNYTGTGIENTGEIEGVSVGLKAHGNVYALAINNEGMVRANGASRANGRVRLSASGGSGNINLGNTSQIYARSVGDGGTIEIDSSSGNIAIGGVLDASGAIDGGAIEVNGQNIDVIGNSSLSVAGLDTGGAVRMDADDSLTIAASVDASGRLDEGGIIELTGEKVMVSSGADLNADGRTDGGRIRVGGEFQGRSGLRASTSTEVEAGAKISADASFGDAGSVVVWADNDTIFRGDVSASASGVAGNGGLIEVSGKIDLTLGGSVKATSRNGEMGTVLFDPGTLTVGYFNGAGGVNEIEIAFINDTLQNGTSVLLMTSGAGSSIIFEDVDLPGAGGAGGSQRSVSLVGADDVNQAFADYTIDFNDPNHPRNFSVQWTSDASFGAFAGGSIIANNHIRTSGEGSINLIAGWTGLESDFSAGGIFDGILTAPGVTGLNQRLGGRSIQDVFEFYVEGGQFGKNGGGIFIGDVGLNRHVEIGSRFGDTSLAGDRVVLTASDVNSESLWAQIGFHDSGELFSALGNNVDNRFDLDLNDRLLEEDNNPLVAVSSYEVLGATLSAERDVNGDGIVDGVYAINQRGLLDGSQVYTGTADDAEANSATFVPYANHFNSSRGGNWWWQQIHEEAVLNRGESATARGGLRPENGAGTSQTDGADINVIARGNVEVNGGGRHGSGAYIGHGGDSTGWGDARAINSNDNQAGETERHFGLNGASNDRSSVSIARLAAVYGNINVLAGVNTDERIRYNGDGEVSATTDDSGSVILEARQEFSGSNNPTNPEDNSANNGAPSQIGHGGAGQFGEFYGDIQVAAADDVRIVAGSNSRGHAAIGHVTNAYQYWNPTSVANQQLRFFRDQGDFNDPLLRRGELFSGVTNVPQQATAALGPGIGDTFAGTRNANQELSDPIAPGAIVIEALSGSVIKGFHGDVEVTATSGDIELVAYETPNTGDPVDGAGGLSTNRDRRFAKIGHGGSGFAEWSDGSGYVPGRTNRSIELIRLYVENDTSGSGSIEGESGSQQERVNTFMSITGDISVDAGGDISLKSGNSESDFAQIGHGGNDLADLETSSFIAGNIDLTAGGDLSLLPSEEIFTYFEGNTGNGRYNDVQITAHTMVGHGGSESGFQGFFGDIDVAVDGEIELKSGLYRGTQSKIGHQGLNDHGQVGGDFSRTSVFDFDSAVTDITTLVTGNQATITYSSVANDPRANGGNALDPTGRQVGINDSRTFDITTNSANITVNSGSDVLLNHLGEGIEQNGRQRELNDTNGGFDNPRDGVALVDDVYVQIGHGGENNDQFRQQNSEFSYSDKLGNIQVNISDGDLNLLNGNGEGRWTRVGHGVGVGDSGNNNFQSVRMSGDIGVNVSGVVLLDAAFASDNGNPLNTDALNGISDPSRYNPTVIGHGGIINSNEIVVLGDGESVNGTAASSDITVEAGEDVVLNGGGGSIASHSQIGHGSSSTQGNNNSRLNGVATGFTGNIDVSAARDVLITASSNGFLQVPSGSGADDDAFSQFGGFAAIGNGGYQIDAPANGDIAVYAGRNVAVTASQRIEGPATSSASTVNAQGNIDKTVSDDDVASVYNFAKIGHVNAEDEVRGGPVLRADQTGDVIVVAGQDLTLLGGTTADIDEAPVYAAFSQIGHGAPGITGDLDGNITVLVGRNLEVTGGTGAEDGPNSTTSPNNYAMIGNGDRIYDENEGERPFIRSEGLGRRSGDITVLVGNTATFDDALVGHGDAQVSSQRTEGNTQIAVSRNNPFYGGSGRLITSGGSEGETTFTSGGFGVGSRLELYMPGRSSNGISAETRLNEASTGFTVSPADFAGLTSETELAGREDEVYLRPDLWWDQGGRADQAGFSGGEQFPTDASSGQGGAIAYVNPSGGFANLDRLEAGALGASADIYRDSNGVSGAGLYTLFFDATVQPFVDGPTNAGPSPTVQAPGFSFNFGPFILLDNFGNSEFEAFDRNDGALQDGVLGNSDSIFGSESLEDADDDSNGTSGISGLENSLDNLLGSRKDSETAEERAEDEDFRRRRGERGVGPLGLTYYVYTPGTNRYSSLRLFGVPATESYLTQ